MLPQSLGSGFLFCSILSGPIWSDPVPPPTLTALTLFACDDSGSVDERYRMNSGPIDAAWDLFVMKGGTSGFAPQDASVECINHPDDHTLSIPLEIGRNVFTIRTEFDQEWSSSGFNLFFGDDLDKPGISAHIQNGKIPEVLPNSSPKTMGWPITEVPGSGTLEFRTDEIGIRGTPPTEGAFIVRLVEIQIQKPDDRYRVDRVGPHSFKPSGKPDWVGRIVLDVTQTTPQLSDLAAWFAINTAFSVPGNTATPESRIISPPFHFDYGGIPFHQAFSDWQVSQEHRPIDNNRSSTQVTYQDPKTGLQVRFEGVEHRDFDTIEWTVYLKNNGTSDSPLISNLQGLDTLFQRRPGDDFKLHYNRGDNLSPTSFEPLVREFALGERFRLTPTGGRPTNFEFPYFNLRAGDEGVIVVVGWPGQWETTFTRESDRSLRIVAGQEETSFVLRPAEEVRTPLIVLQYSEQGDWIDAQNKWRRWMIERNIPRPNGQPLKLPGFAACSSHQFAEMTKASEKNQIEFIDSYLEKGLKIDYWWMDAGWYVGAEEKNWPWTGTWEVDRRPHRFPNGLRAVSDHAHSKGVKIIVWFEPERVAGGTWLATEHPEWILGKDGGLLNLGNPEAWNWLANHIDKIITDEGIDLYRQDFNIDPLQHWRDNDAPDRIGITENFYIKGYLAYWDELIRRHPGLLIDSCASGGRRNDLETLRRAVPLLRSDYLFEPVGQQCHTYGLSLWIPFYGTGYTPSNSVGWGWGTGGISYDPYTRRSNMCPNNTACFDFREPVDDALIQKLYHEWLQAAPNFFGDYYPITEYSTANDEWIAWQFHRVEEGAGMVQAFRRTETPFFGGQFKLRGLDPDAAYQIVNFDSSSQERKSGRALMEQGIEIALKEKPGAAVVLYQRVPE